MVARLRLGDRWHMGVLLDTWNPMLIAKPRPEDMWYKSTAGRAVQPWASATNVFVSLQAPVGRLMKTSATSYSRACQSYGHEFLIQL